MDPLEFVCEHEGSKSSGPQVLEEGQRREVFHLAEGIKELLGKKDVKNKRRKRRREITGDTVRKWDSVT
jgi:hypothetical protein